jgi:glycosyltransferase involved in cell wall biosynthesis
MKGLLIVVNFEQEQEIARFLGNLGRQKHGLDVVVVDDGSKDESPQIASRAGYKVLAHPINLGVGAAIRTGIEHALSEGLYEFVVIMSSNGKMHPEELHQVTRPILTGTHDYVQGSRFMKDGQVLALSRFRSAAIPLYSAAASMVLGRVFTDITCGFRAYRLWIVRDARVDLGQKWLNRYELELYIHYYACRLGARIVEVPVTIDYSHLARGRKSKMTPFVSWWSILRPFLLLGLRLKK